MTTDYWTSSELRVGNYYLLGGTVHVIVRSEEGRVYAKRLVIEGRRGRWVYAHGATRRLRDLAPLTRAELAALGRAYGVCCICGATLSEPASVARGMGRRCAGLD